MKRRQKRKHLEIEESQEDDEKPRESLQEHVRFGVREGFSCYVFHLIMARLIRNAQSESTQEEEEDNNEEKEKSKEKTSEEQQSTEKDGEKKPWSQCPGCMFDSPKDR
ncbi:hypothetical protein A6R68_07573, partial [Neotoma lepida]